jgi:6-pyruvoyltetrahydropterin/6-carboxytetrahydropterin synthase|uniref:6-pyruvoyl trahydropterin synthase family protein n=1 Tax=Nonomuraea sp. CA-252377 TaxID=3240003 RepID=UPI003F49AA01
MTDLPVPDGMRCRIVKRFSFDAAHQLSSDADDPHALKPGHKCTRLHGHTYQVEVVVEAAALTGPGFVTEFGALAPFGDYLSENLDHRFLNEVLPVAPTSENVAVHLARWFAKHVQPAIPGRLAGMRVSETPGTWAECWLAAP